METRLKRCCLGKEIAGQLSMSRQPPYDNTVEINDYLKKYAYTIGLRRRDWAWEFLRRNPKFLVEAYANFMTVQRSMSCIADSKILHLYERCPLAETWGLMFFPNPDQPAPRADVYWLSGWDPAIVTMKVSKRNSGEIDEMKAVIDGCQIDVLRDFNGTEHLLTRGDYSSAQSICSGMSLLHAKEPVRVDLDTRGPDRMHRAYDAYKLAEEILHPGPFKWTERTLRLRNALICLDATAAGLSLRDAAEIIYGRARVESEWSRQRTMRDRMRSYSRAGQTLADGGYRRLLQGGPLNVIETAS
ncbi:MAG: DUF2285 domain-containing protein [Pseudomonadota bacterium]